MLNTNESDKGKALLAFIQRTPQSLPEEPSPSVIACPTIASADSLEESRPVIEASDNFREDVAIKKKTSYVFRVVKKQEGSINVYTTGRRAGDPEVLCEREDFGIHPEQRLTVAFTVPEHLFKDEVNKNLVIALLRYGSSSNTSCLIAKSLPKTCSVLRNTNGNVLVSGKISFRAPKGSGKYVFRLFDQHTDKEKAAVTLATSLGFLVVLLDADVTRNLLFCLEAVNDNISKGLYLLIANVKCIRNSGRVYQQKDPKDLLRKLLITVLIAVEEGIAKLDESERRLDEERLAKSRVLNEASKPTFTTLSFDTGDDFDELMSDVMKISLGHTGAASGPAPAATLTPAPAEEANGVDPRNAEYWADIRAISRIQAEAYECIVEVIRNGIVMHNMLDESMRAVIMKVESLFCPLLRRFFKEYSDALPSRMRVLSFVPSPPILRSQSSPALLLSVDRILLALNLDIQAMLPSLMPGDDFRSKREIARMRIQTTLLESGAIPVGTVLVVYGSSLNSFGAENADVDMCLSFPSGIEIPAANKVAFLTKIGETLEIAGMDNVSVRATARIPIVTFMDPVSGLECDISFFNPLAIRNTQLLLAYSMADFRVRPLVFLIKHWAKRRNINNPGRGTLGSYAYVLCLLHFLQTQQVIPNLQRLPRHWRGLEGMVAGTGKGIDAVAADEMTELYRLQTITGSDKQIETHPVDGCTCNTYFYSEASAEQAQLVSHHIQVFCSRNKDSLAKLLVGFFEYFAWKFDYRNSSVSIQHPSGAVSKAVKEETDAWSRHDRISIEDPFEVWYDVAHVVKAPQNAYIRKEFLRAHTLVSRSAGHVVPMDTGAIPPGIVDEVESSLLLHGSGHRRSLFDLICDEQLERLPFEANRERAVSAVNA